MHDLARVGSRLRHGPVVWVAGFEPASSSFQARWATTTRHPEMGWLEGPAPSSTGVTTRRLVSFGISHSPRVENRTRVSRLSAGCSPTELRVDVEQCPRPGSNQHLSLFRRAPSPEWLQGRDDGVWRPRRCAAIELSKNGRSTLVLVVGTAGFEPARRRSKLRGLPVSRCPSIGSRRLGARDSNPDERGQSAPSLPIRSAPSEPAEESNSARSVKSRLLRLRSV